jgi:hypothetical protein
MGAYAMYEKHGGKDLSARRMATRMKRYEERIDPSGELARRDPQELATRVEAALKLDMEKVRYARTQRAADRRALQEMLLHTPPDDQAQLAAITAALSLNQRGDRTTKTEAASALTEAAPKPHNLRKQAKIVSSDGGEVTIAPTSRRRQTSTPVASKKATTKKATKRNDNLNSHSLN